MSNPDLNELLDATFPLRHGLSADWNDVLTRAQHGTTSVTAVPGTNRTHLAPERRSSRWRWRKPVSRQRLTAVLALVAALGLVVAVTPAGSAIVRGFSDFETWLTGEPGSPASVADQRAFDRAIRSWHGFPASTQLRQLVHTHAGGETFSLYGFRGAGSLCLQLVTSGDSRSGRELICPPLSSLRAATQPALVAIADYDVGVSARPAPPAPLPILRIRPPAAMVTLGIVADGVQHVELTYNNGDTTSAIVHGDAFLGVVSDPAAGERLTGVYAIAGGKRVAIRFVSPSSFTIWSPSWPVTVGPRLTAHGPASVQRVVYGDGIGWLNRREPIGEPVPSAIHNTVGARSSVTFEREITPNPAAPERMVVSIGPANASYGRLRGAPMICANVVAGRYPNAGGCWFADEIFSTAPFSESVAEGTGGQYITISGLASDTVARLKLFLGTGQKVAVPLHDNGYVVEAPTIDYPIRLAAYDRDGLVIGIRTFLGNQQIRPAATQRDQPLPNAHWRLVVKSSAGRAYTTPATNGGRCYAVQFISQQPNGDGMFDCAPTPPPDSANISHSSYRHGTTTIVFSGAAVRSVVVRYHDGQSQTLRPADGIALGIPPAGTSALFGYIASVTVVTPNGHLVTRRGALPASGGAGTIRQLTSASISIGPARTTSSAHHPFAPVGDTCRIAATSPPLSGYRPGNHVQYLCQNGVLTLIGHSAANTLWVDRTTLTVGPIDTLTPTTISITESADETPGRVAPVDTCTITSGSPYTRAYRVHELVEAFCAHGTLTGINRAAPNP